MENRRSAAEERARAKINECDALAEVLAEIIEKIDDCRILADIAGESGESAEQEKQEAKMVTYRKALAAISQ